MSSVLGASGCTSGELCLEGTRDKNGDCPTAQNIDNDGDGVIKASDCDDSDATLGAVSDDADCDGALTADDCDDDDATSNTLAEDADCDGSVTADDCDDDDATSNTLAEDADCDGVLTADDCDDDDASFTSVAEDADCDGSVTADDCDDANAGIYPGAPETWNDGIDQDCDGMADAANATCTSSFVVGFPDGTSTTLDGCLDWDMDLEYEFDPDDPPEVNALKITFGAGIAANFDCEIEVEQDQVCGTGFYDVATAHHSTAFTLVDCSDVADEYERSYRAYVGYLELTRVDAGPTSGGFSGLPLSTTVEGYLSVEERNGISVSGSFALSLEKLGVDDEQHSDCAVTDGDEDGDGHVDEYFAGDDCDDDDSDAYPGAPETWYDGIDSNCDEANDYDADADGYDSYLYSGTDCDDNDPSSTTQATDADCDGVLTADDCDDTDPSVGDSSLDGDCDGTPTVDDCDDNNADLFDLTVDGTSETLSTGTYTFCDVNLLDSATLVVEGAVEIEAESFNVEIGSTVDGVGQGGDGGDSTAGGGDGGGEGGTNAGAGGGGYGNDGGVAGYDDNGDTAGNGGVEYGASDTYEISMGSGGGSTSNATYEAGAGGNGGNGLLVTATTITVSGTIDLSGNDAADSSALFYGGGGGSGGGLLLHGDVITIDGDLLAAGGSGGNASTGQGDAGGGGAGGRIKVFWGTSLTGGCATTACWNVTGGAAGTGEQDGTAGGDGTTYEAQSTWP